MGDIELDVQQSISSNLSLQEHIPEWQLRVYPCPPLSWFSSRKSEQQQHHCHLHQPWGKDEIHHQKVIEYIHLLFRGYSSKTFTCIDWITEVWNIATTEFFCLLVLMPEYSKAFSSSFPTCNNWRGVSQRMIRQYEVSTLVQSCRLIL